MATVRRRDLLRQSGTMLAVATALGTAGCSGDDGGTETDGGSTDDEESDGGDSDATEAPESDDGETAMDDGGDGTAMDEGETAMNDGGDGTAMDDGGTATPAGEVDVELSDGGPYSLNEYSNSVDGIQVVSLSSGIDVLNDRELFENDVEVRNTGSEPTEVKPYTYTVTLYDESGTEVQSGTAQRSTRGGGDPIAPGETETVFLTLTLEGTNGREIDSYDLTIDCSGIADGAYC